MSRAKVSKVVKASETPKPVYVDMPPALWQSAKVAAATSGLTLREWLIRLIAKGVQRAK